MAKAKNNRTAPVQKQTTEPSAPTTNPENDPTVVPPVTDQNTDDQSNVTPPVQGAAAQAPVNDDPTPPVEDEEPEQVEVKESMKRAELDAVATEAGLTNVKTYKDKAAVVAAVERVRAGEDAAAVDAEFTPEVTPTGATTEVEAANPFYDVQGKVNRRSGDKFKVTEARATELRGYKLIK